MFGEDMVVDAIHCRWLTKNEFLLRRDELNIAIFT